MNVDLMGDIEVQCRFYLHAIDSMGKSIEMGDKRRRAPTNVKVQWIHKFRIRIVRICNFAVVVVVDILVYILSRVDLRRENPIARLCNCLCAKWKCQNFNFAVSRECREFV